MLVSRGGSIHGSKQKIRGEEVKPVGDDDLSSASGVTLDAELKMSTALNNLEVVVLEGEDSSVIVVKNHDGSGSRHFQLGNGESTNTRGVQDETVLGTDAEVLEMEVEVLVLFEYVVINDFNADFLNIWMVTVLVMVYLVLVLRVEGEGSLDRDEVGSSVGGSVLGVVVDHNCESVRSSVSSNDNVEGSDIFQDGVMSGVEEDLAGIVSGLLLLGLQQLK